jgi:hypothetical protein
MTGAPAVAAITATSTFGERWRGRIQRGGDWKFRFEE